MNLEEIRNDSHARAEDLFPARTRPPVVTSGSRCHRHAQVRRSAKDELWMS
jgi:hypothetical protein